MTKQIIGREDAVEALSFLCRDYRGTALKAIRKGGEEVYIPANTMNPNGLLQALANPHGMIQLESQCNELHKEPCYATLDEFLAGRNSDGSEHSGYFAIDVVAKMVIDIKDRSGRSVLPSPEIGSFSTLGAARQFFGGEKNSYCP